MYINITMATKKTKSTEEKHAKSDTAPQDKVEAKKKKPSTEKKPADEKKQADEKKPKETSETKASEKKEKTSSKEKTKKRFEGVEKGDAPNTATAYINCILNVNHAKTRMKKLIEKMKYDVGTLNAQYAYTAIAEVIVIYVVRTSCEFNAKNSEKADLFEVTLDSIKNGVRKSADLPCDIKLMIDNYNASNMLDYTQNFFDEEKRLKKLIVKRAFENKTNVAINASVINLLCYVVSTLLGRLTHAACVIGKRCDRKNIGIKDYVAACEILFTGVLASQLEQRLSEIDDLFANKKETDMETETHDKKSPKKEKPSKKEGKSKRDESDKEENANNSDSDKDSNKDDETDNDE